MRPSEAASYLGRCHVESTSVYTERCPLTLCGLERPVPCTCRVATAQVILTNAQKVTRFAITGREVCPCGSHKTWIILSPQGALVHQQATAGETIPCRPRDTRKDQRAPTIRMENETNHKKTTTTLIRDGRQQLD
ncbi:hypothetical protein PoB_005914500 [Plakobranchus ocellatus]|uniref:Uncharacterized protein n=1 Tax=Plakobranchus ocellatus TaxID=259542 RepID=A0AAV4CLM3_9GAST|nr:hypothetical protein PoB_005914500 [Plakobranchus ocellatus]